MDKKVTIKYWQVLPLNKVGENFEDAVKSLLTKKEEDLHADLEEIPYQIVIDKDQTGPFYVGDVIRMQGVGLPSRLKKGGKAQKLQLERGEYLGYHTGFIYDTEYDLLGFEIKPSAAGLNKLLALVSHITLIDNFATVPVITQNDLTRLADAKNSRFSFKVADPSSLQAVDPKHATIRENLNELKGMVDATYLNITVGVGRRKHGLEKSTLMQLAGWLLGEKDAKRGGVKSVKAFQPKAAEQLLDFVKAQVKDSSVLPLTGLPDDDWKLRSEFLMKSVKEARKHVKKPKRGG